MALFDVGSLPPWMIQRESPIDALAKGVQAGSAIAHNILAARSLAIDEQARIIAQQNQIRMTQSLANFGKYMGTVQDYADPKSEAGAYALLESSPWLGQTPAFKEGIDNFRIAREAKELRVSREKISADLQKSHEKIAAEATEARLEARPGSMSSVIGKLDAQGQADFNRLFPSYKTGKALSTDDEAKAFTALEQLAVQSDERQTERERAKQELKSGGPESPLGKLYADRDAAVKAGKSASVIEAFDAAIQENITNKGRSIYMGQDDQGRPIFQMTEGGAKGIATVATQSKIQQDLVQYGVNYELLADIRKELRPEDVGMLGVAGEYALDRLAAQFGGAGFDPKRSSNREKLRVSIQGLARLISTDPRFSEADRKRAEAAQASVGALESYPRAIEVIKTLQGVLADRARQFAPAAGMPLPLWSMSPEEIKARYKAEQNKPGGLTFEQASDAIRRFHPDF